MWPCALIIPIASKYLRDAQNFLNRRYSGLHFIPSIFLQSAHALCSRRAGEICRIGVADDQLAQFLAHFHQLENSDSSLETCMRTGFATGSLIQFVLPALGRKTSRTQPIALYDDFTFAPFAY